MTTEKEDCQRERTALSEGSRIRNKVKKRARAAGLYRRKGKALWSSFSLPQEREGERAEGALPPPGHVGSLKVIKVVGTALACRSFTALGRHHTELLRSGRGSDLTLPKTAWQLYFANHFENLPANTKTGDGLVWEGAMHHLTADDQVLGSLHTWYKAKDCPFLQFSTLMEAWLSPA